MSARIAGHLRSNVYGLIAVFVALSGTAYATHPGGTNTISSQDIINGQVFGADVADDTADGGGLGHVDIKSGAVRTSEIGQGAILSEDVADDTEAGGGLGAFDLAADAVGLAEMQDNAVGSAQILAGAVGSAEIGTDAVGPLEVAANAIDNDEIEDGSVGSAELGTNAVGNSEMADNAVGSSEVSANSLRLGDLAIGITDESTANLSGTVAAGSCSSSFNDGLEFGDAPIGSHTLAYHVRRSNGSPNPGWTVDGVTTTTLDAGRIRFCNNTGSNADPPELTYSYMTIAP